LQNRYIGLMSNAHRHRFVSFLANVLLASLLLRLGR
jgi:uncharacterized membrane protein